MRAHPVRKYYVYKVQVYGEWRVTPTVVSIVASSADEARELARSQPGVSTTGRVKNAGVAHKHIR